MISNLDKQVKDNNQPLCEDTNIFPKLIMKDKKKIIHNNKVKVKKIKLKEIIEVEVEASTYRIGNIGSIYDFVDGNIIYIWEKNTSFTSHIEHENWLKVTGIFIDKQWTAPKQELWIPKVNAVKR